MTTRNKESQYQQFDYNTLPQTLKEQKRFCLWKIINNTKIPINALTNGSAKSNDPSTWSDFETAVKNLPLFRANGIGFMLGSGFFGVDIDEDNKELISEFVSTLKSYTEYSQSGKGIHIICKGVLPVGRRRKGTIEMYDSVRFFALTGNKVEGTEDYDVEDRTDEIKTLYDKYLKEEEKEVYSASGSTTRLLTNTEIINKILSSKNANLFSLLYYGNYEGLYKSQSQADIALCNILAFWCNKNKEQMNEIFKSSKLYRPKWDEKRGELTYGELTLNQAINNCRNTYSTLYQTSSGYYITPNGEKIETPKEYSLNDTGNAERFVDTFGEDIRYNVDNKVWMIWNGKFWQVDEKEEIKKRADILVKMIKEEAINEEDKDKSRALLKNANRIASNIGKNAMLKEAQHLSNIAIKNNEFDINPYLLNAQNGVIDLRNGTIQPHNKNFYMSKICSYNCEMDLKPNLWNKFISEIFCEDKDLINFIHKAIGYSFTGLNREQCFFELTGEGGNGKSVFLNTIYEILGNYIINMDIKSILNKNNNNNGASSDIARLNGVRFVRTNEPDEGSRFAEGLVKQLTGGDVVTARFLYGKEFEFKPYFKLWIACNSKIIVRGTDKGIWRRIRVINFNKIFNEQTADKGLEEKLKAEASRILGWCVKGAMKYFKEGLEMCESVRSATKEYQTEMDIVSQFIDEEIESSILGKIQASVLYARYKERTKNGNEYTMTQTKFGRECAKRFKKQNINGTIYYTGITFKNYEQYQSR